MFGPGSFFTSIMPHFLVDGLAEAISRNRRAPRVFIGNILECAETRGRSLSELVLAQLPPPLSRLELSQTEAIKQAVAAGLGIAVLPQVAVAEAVAAGRLEVLKTPFLQPFLRRKLSLLLHRRRYRGALLEAFLASL